MDENDAGWKTDDECEYDEEMDGFIIDDIKEQKQKAN